MGIVTEVKLNKAQTRAKVYIDGEFCADIACDIAYKYDVATGAVMDAEQLETIIFESEKTVCTEYLIQYLCKFPCSEKKAVLKLKDKGYSPQSIENSVKIAKEYGYINDYDYAKRYADSKISNCGTHKIKSELSRLGINSAVISEILSDLDGDEVMDGAMNLARKWWRSRDIDDRTDKNKFVNYMNSRGYEWSVTSKCLDAIRREEKENADETEE